MEVDWDVLAKEVFETGGYKDRLVAIADPVSEPKVSAKETNSGTLVSMEVPIPCLRDDRDTFVVKTDTGYARFLRANNVIRLFDGEEPREEVAALLERWCNEIEGFVAGQREIISIGD